MSKFIIIMVMFFPNFADYENGNVLVVSHKHDKELIFKTQIECFEYVTKNIDELLLFGVEAYSNIDGAAVSEFLCVTKEASGELEKKKKGVET